MKYKEYWIDEMHWDAHDSLKSYEKAAVDESIMVHLIEYKAYEDLKTKLDMAIDAFEVIYDLDCANPDGPRERLYCASEVARKVLAKIKDTNDPVD